MANQDRPNELSNGRVLLTATLVTVTVVAWGVLVFAAIDYGRTARDGVARDWAFLLLATLGAVGCMFAAIVMAARLQSMMRSARSSTRPLAQPLDELPPLPHQVDQVDSSVQPGPSGRPGDPGAGAYPAGAPAPQPAVRTPNPHAGKRAARR